MKTWYFSVDSPGVRFAGVVTPLKEDAEGDLRRWLEGYYKGSGSRIKKGIPKPRGVEFIHQFGTPEWILVPRTS